MIQSLQNLVTDGQTDESDFIERCPTNVEHPNYVKKNTQSKQKQNKVN